jgi:hypothetical protein
MRKARGRVNARRRRRILGMRMREAEREWMRMSQSESFCGQVRSDRTDARQCPVRFVEIWLILMLMLSYCERKTMFIR